MAIADQIDLSPAERRRRKVREAILDAAERVYAEDGEAGLSIRRLADAIDYSPAAIYKYFGSKTELVDELKEAFFGRILACVDRMNSSDAPFHERARSCVAVYVTTALEKPHHYVGAFTGEVERSEHAEAPGVPDFIETNKGRAFAHLAKMVAEGQVAGILRDDVEPELAAKSIWASSHGLAMMMAHMPGFPDFQHDGTDAQRESFIALHADLVVRGLEK